MDLIDASNVPTSATVDPITGNTISTNEDANVTAGAQMIDGEALNNGVDGNTEDYIIDNAPTFQYFNTLPPETKAKIPRLLLSISLVWDVISPATPFPTQYLPDPDCHNWGLSFIASLNRLAELTRSGNKLDAIYYATRHMKERNEISGNTADEDISVSMVMAGDFVIRLEDIEYSIYKMRSRVDTYRPGQHGQGRGRGNYRGGRGGRRGRGSGAHGTRVH